MFPDYGGRFPVGLTGFCFGTPSTSYSSASFPNGQKILQMKEVAFNVFYPADLKNSKIEKGMNWLARPLEDSMAGYAKFMGLGCATSLMWPFIHLFGRFLQMPVYPDAPLLKPTPKRGASSAESKPAQWPLVIFSHGLAGGRTTYSRLCGRLASEGYIVMAIEHRDGSGPICSIRSPEDGSNAPLLYTRLEDIKWDPESSKPTTAMPLRTEQLEFRIKEIYAAYDAFTNMVEGDHDALHLLDGQKESESWWSTWKGAVNCREDIALIGHSFGGATSLALLSSPPPPGHGSIPLSHTLLFDPWLEPLPSPGPVPSPQHGTSVPFAVINSEAFTIWTSHFDRLQDLVRTWKQGDDPHALLTIARSTHQEVSDFSLMVPLVKGRSVAYLESLHSLTMAFLDNKLKEVLEGDDLGPRVKRTIQMDEIKGKKVIRGDRGDIIIHAL